jgi:flagellin
MELSGSDMNLDDVLTSIYGVDTETVPITMAGLPDGTTIDVDGVITTIDTTAVPPVTGVTAPPNTLVVIKLPTPGTTTVNGQTINAGEKLAFRTGSANVAFNNAGTTLAIGSESTVILPNDNANNKNQIDLSTSESANKALGKIDQAIESASKIRSKLGAYQNRLEHTVSNLGVSEENMTGALSRIQDADMALEMANYTQLNILSQAATSMLAQANQRPQQILQLLQR